MSQTDDEIAVRASGAGGIHAVRASGAGGIHAVRASGAGGIRAVRLMVDELRQEPIPELPWDEMEKRLLARIAERSAVAMIRRPAPPPSPFARVAGFAIAAAVLALGIGSATSSGRMPTIAEAPRHAVDATTVALAPALGGPRDLAALHVGDVVEAHDRAVTFGQAGLVTWTLAPGSALRVRSVGLGHTVELERGSLHAEVTPRAASEGLVEAFAVEVEGTRVAVHGTAFSVQRVGAGVVVDVEHGAVAVGPVGNAGTTTGHLLVGPARASFSLDGGRVARLMDRPDTAPVAALGAEASVANLPPVAVGRPSEPSEPADPSASARVAPPTGHTEGAAIAARAPAPRGREPGAQPAPDAAPVEAPRLTADTVRGRIDRCFRRVYEAAPSTLEVASTLSIDLNPDGSVRAARFTPPLKPELTECAGRALAGRFADDAGRVEVQVSFKP